MFGNEGVTSKQQKIEVVERTARALEKHNELEDAKREPRVSKRTGNIVAAICTIVLIGAACWVLKDVKMVGMITNSIKYIK